MQVSLTGPRRLMTVPSVTVRETFQLWARLQPHPGHSRGHTVCSLELTSVVQPVFSGYPRKAEGRSERTHATPFRPPRPSCAHLPLGGPVERPNVRIPDSRENLLPRVFVRIAKQVLPVRLTRPKSADPPAGRKSLGVFVFTCEMMFGT